MKVLVCISHVPDTTTKINFTPDNKSFITQGVQFIINPYDEIALTRALELTEKSGGSVTVINVGEIATEPTIRKALAIGASDAVRVNAHPKEAMFVATQIAEYLKKNSFDLILCGRESIDFNSASVPSMIAEMLNIPSVAIAKTISVENGKAVVEREIEGGKEVLECALPLVAGCSESIAVPRIPNMRGIMSARTKPLVVVEPVAADEYTKVIGYDKPAQRSSVKLVDAAEPGKLLELLHTEKKII
ncbi:MAG TPA: electron transfer flavoprotein subunit beta/FixA family protein [Bacteroidia bacterium]|nr:electron transfer flavoprotein subunit beta/FixA family protein [Bacteroidia bacterium]